MGPLGNSSGLRYMDRSLSHPYLLMQNKKIREAREGTMIFRSINPCLVKRKLAKKKQMVLSSLPLYTSLPSSTLARLHLFFCYCSMQRKHRCLFVRSYRIHKISGVEKKVIIERAKIFQSGTSASKARSASPAFRASTAPVPQWQNETEAAKLPAAAHPGDEGAEKMAAQVQIPHRPG